MARELWTADQTLKLKELITKKGYTSYILSNILGKSRSAVVSKVARMGWRLPNSLTKISHSSVNNKKAEAVKRKKPHRQQRSLEPQLINPVVRPAIIGPKQPGAYSLFELSSTMCHWPEDTGYCGQDSFGSYCTMHRTRMYAPPKPRNPR